MLKCGRGGFPRAFQNFPVPIQIFWCRAGVDIDYPDRSFFHTIEDVDRR